jgi:Ni,Fe-hydrogenase I cytochrome b subunit
MKFSLSFRIWHWLNAIIIFGLLGTVFLRQTFLSWKTNSEILINKLQEINIEITSTQAKVLAKSIQAGMWEWHIILGYGLAFLVLFRIYLYFKDSSKRESFNSLSLHKKIVHVSYYIINATLIIIAITGLVVHFYQELGIIKETAHDIKEIHEFAYNIILYFVPLHILGVIIAENRDEKGIISSIVNGKE